MRIDLENTNIVGRSTVDADTMDEMRKKLCGNCGESGHLWRNCTQPITSYGIMAFRRSALDYPPPKELEEELGELFRDGGPNDVKMLMVQRKDTIGFVDFLRGRYPNDSSALEQIMTFMREMTQRERENLETMPFEVLWDELWINHHSRSFVHERAVAQSKFQKIDIKHLLEKTKSSSQWAFTEWNPPKGRRGKFETNLDCAQREFREESGYKREHYRLLNVEPIIENFIGTNGIQYRHVYFIATILPEIEVPKINIFNKNQAGEVRQVAWFNLKQSLALIRDYDSEKKNVIRSGFEIYLKAVTSDEAEEISNANTDAHPESLSASSWNDDLRR